MKQLVTKIKDHFTSTESMNGGIYSAGNLSFYLSLVFYLVSFLVFADDSFFWGNGIFHYTQTFIPIVFALILVACLNWELLLFGKPAGLNLFLQCCQIFPFALFLARMIGKPTEKIYELPSWIGRWISQAKEIMNEVIKIKVPQWMIDIFFNPGMFFLLCIFLVVISFRKKIFKIGGIVFMLCLMFTITVASNPSWQLFAGAVLLISGLALQYSRYDRNIFAIHVEQNLFRYGAIDDRLCQTIRAIMVQLQEPGSKVSEPQLFQMVKDIYGRGMTYCGNDLKLISIEIVQKMTYTYGLIRLDMSSAGKFIIANPSLYCADNLLMTVAVVPRIIFAAVVMVVWIISPVDLIPDAIPFIGSLDDFVITCVSGFVMTKSCDLLKGNKADGD